MENSAFQVIPVDSRTLRLVGDLDMATVPSLHAALQLLHGDGSITLDLEGLSFLDSSGLNEFARCARSLDGHGPLILVNVPGRISLPPRDGRLRQDGHGRDPMMAEHHDAPVISLAERLKSRREQLGLSQAQAARELDVARTAYRLWEMEAAKPQPDRWRLISRWLGVSVTTMLLADELDDEPETASVSAAFARAGSSWDARLRDPHEFFAEMRQLVRGATEEGFINPEHAEELLATMARAEQDRIGSGTETWEPARVHKQFATTPQAPRKAREAVDFVAGDLPEEDLQTAQLLTSELVTNSVKHSPSTNATISVDLEINRTRLRVEVRDGATTSPVLIEPGEEGGYGLVFVDRLSSRWDTERERAGNLTWFEIDLPVPGAKPERP